MTRDHSHRTAPSKSSGTKIHVLCRLIHAHVCSALKSQIVHQTNERVENKQGGREGEAHFFPLLLLLLLAHFSNMSIKMKVSVVVVIWRTSYLRVSDNQSNIIKRDSCIFGWVKIKSASVENLLSKRSIAGRALWIMCVCVLSLRE